MTIAEFCRAHKISVSKIRRTVSASASAGVRKSKSNKPRSKPRPNADDALPVQPSPSIPQMIIEPAAYTIEEFCKAHKISLGLYYKIKKAGTGPREKEINNRRIITREAAVEWRKV
jgi:hypothetical protein